MKHLALLAALLLAGFSAFGTTVTGIVANITGDAFTTNLLFTPTPLPGTSGGSVVAGSAKLVVATNGVFSTELVGGRYTVRINPRAPFVIWVPSSGTYALTQLYKDANGGVVPADAPFLPVTGGEVSGNIRFSGALSGGVIPPYLSTAQRDALNVVSNGMTIWNVSTAEVQVYQSGIWTNLAGGGGGSGITFTTASNAAFALRSIIVDTNAGANYSVTNLNAITYIRNTNSGAGEVSTAQLNTASNALFGASSFTNTLYVAPWGNDSTATRGSIDKPYSLSNAFVQVRNNERIAVMGSNYVGVRVPLPIGSSYVVSNVITAPLFLSNKANITISGVAGGGIYWDNYGTVAAYFRSTNIITENLIWDGLTKMGAGTNGFASTITILESADGLVFRGNTFKNFTAQGIYALNQLFDGYSHVRNVWIMDNYFNNIGDQNYGVFGDGTAIVPNGDNWIVSRNVFDNLLRGIEHYNSPGSYGTQYGHVYSDNVMSNIWHVGIFQLNEGSHSNTLGGLKIHGNTISMSKIVVGNVSNQTGGIELRGPLKDATVQGNTIEATNTLAAFGVVVSASNGSVDGIDIFGNTARGFAFRGYQITANSSTNTMKNGRIFGNTAMFGGNGIQIGGTDMIVGYNTIEDYGNYGIYVEGPSSGVQVFGNIMAGGGSGNYVEATATNVVLQNNFDRGKFAATGDATPTLTDLGVGTKTEQNWPYNNFQIPGTNTAGYLNVQFVSILNDLRASAAYLTNVSIYNAVDFVASKAANSNNRFITLSNTANANVMWDALMNHAGWLSWYQPVYGNYGIIQHTNGNVSLGDYNSGNLTNYGTVLLKGNGTNASPNIMLTRNSTTGAIEDSAVPVGGSVTTNFITIASGSATLGSLVVSNSVDAGTLVITNFDGGTLPTNGTVVHFWASTTGSNMVKTAVPAGGGSASSTFFNNVTNYGAVGNGTTDDTAAIQAAINAGRPVMFPPGTYKHTGVYLTNGSHLAAQVRGTALLTLASNANRHSIVGTNVSNAVIEGLVVDGNKFWQSGWTNNPYYATNQSSGVMFFLGTNNVVRFTTVKQAQFAGVHNSGSREMFSGWNTGVSNGWGSFYYTRRMRTNVDTNLHGDVSGGMIWQSTADYDDCDSVRVTSASGVTVEGNTLQRSLQGVVIVGFAGVYLEDAADIRVLNNLVAFHSGMGIDYGDDYTSVYPFLQRNILVQGNTVFSNQGNGLQIKGKGGIWQDNEVFDNGQSGGGLSYGIQLAGPFNTVSGNVIYQTRGNTGHSYGIKESPGSSEWNVVTANRCFSNQIDTVTVNGNTRKAGNFIGRKGAVDVLQVGSGSTGEGVSITGNDQFGFNYYSATADGTGKGIIAQFSPAATGVSNPYFFYMGHQGESYLTHHGSSSSNAHRILVENTTGTPWKLQLGVTRSGGDWSSPTPVGIELWTNGIVRLPNVGTGVLKTASDGQVSAISGITTNFTQGGITWTFTQGVLTAVSY